eukprot:876136-Prymnesium_polylepis.1
MSNELGRPNQAVLGRGVQQVPQEGSVLRRIVQRLAGSGAALLICHATAAASHSFGRSAADLSEEPHDTAA